MWTKVGDWRVRTWKMDGVRRGPANGIEDDAVRRQGISFRFKLSVPPALRLPVFDSRRAPSPALRLARRSAPSLRCE